MGPIGNRPRRTGFFEAVCRGAAAGLAGTAAMTLSSILETKLRGRGESEAPAEAAGKVLGVQPRDEEGRSRFSNAMHWAYGTGWGAARGILDFVGLRPRGATAVHLGAVWGAQAVMLPKLEVAPPVHSWGPAEVAVDLTHHGIYAGATSIAYEALR